MIWFGTSRNSVRTLIGLRTVSSSSQDETMKCWVSHAKTSICLPPVASLNLRDYFGDSFPYSRLQFLIVFGWLGDTFEVVTVRYHRGTPSHDFSRLPQAL